MRWIARAVRVALGIRRRAARVASHRRTNTMFATTAVPSFTLARAPRRSSTTTARAHTHRVTSTTPHPSMDTVASAPTRRDALVGFAALVASARALDVNAPALAISGMNVVKDTREGYQFLYPVGWQEIQVDGQAAVYKDIIEPLESAALNVYPTQRESVADIGTAEEVANTLVGKALTAPGAQAKVLKASERKDDAGHLYYAFEFVTKTKSYERHALTVVTITQGKFYTLTTGSSEKRWGKIKDRLQATVDSFQVYY